MKDAKGHGSEKRGGGGMADLANHPGWKGNTGVAAAAKHPGWAARGGPSAASAPAVGGKAAWHGVMPGGTKVTNQSGNKIAYASPEAAVAGAAHQAGIQQVGNPSLDREAVLRKFNSNEDNNFHSENVALLAKHFGTPAEQSMANEIIKERDRIGQLPDRTQNVPNVRDFQYAVNKSYFPLLIGNRGAKK